MDKILRLYNTFTRTTKPVELNSKLVTSFGSSRGPGHSLNGTFYICGPTVYAESHIGHALTYIKADLFRRILKSYFNVNLITAMNITDIDDKILKRCDINEITTTDPNAHPFNKISLKYYASFLDDLSLLRIRPPDICVPVSKNISLITEYIRQLERTGYAYVGQNNDILFDVSKVHNYIGRTDKRPLGDDRKTKISLTKDQDERDFTLWKKAKPHEPVWNYKSTKDDQIIPGRPGWHVQCSAIASQLFGSELDFHFGGKDLIFPHHYNEEACCCAFHKLDTSSSLHVWCRNWLHSGHLTIKMNDNENAPGEKMSKSLQNTILIKDFVDRTSINSLRLLCVLSHYRSDCEYNGQTLNNIKGIDHKLNSLLSYLLEGLSRIHTLPLEAHCYSKNHDGLAMVGDNDIQLILTKTQEAIIDGICDDFDLNQGLEAILNFSKVIYSRGLENLNPLEIIASLKFLHQWCTDIGLHYPQFDTLSSSNLTTKTDMNMLNMLKDFRSQVRKLALDSMKSNDGNLASNILKECDNIRSSLDSMGHVERDPKSNN